MIWKPFDVHEVGKGALTRSRGRWTREAQAASGKIRRFWWQNTEQPTLETDRHLKKTKQQQQQNTCLKYQGENFRKYLCEVTCYLRKTRTDEDIWPGQRAVDYWPLHDLATWGRRLTLEEGLDNVWTIWKHLSSVNTKSLGRGIPGIQRISKAGFSFAIGIWKVWDTYGNTGLHKEQRN